MKKIFILALVFTFTPFTFAQTQTIAPVPLKPHASFVCKDAISLGFSFGCDKEGKNSKKIVSTKDIVDNLAKNKEICSKYIDYAKNYQGYPFLDNECSSAIYDTPFEAHVRGATERFDHVSYIANIIALDKELNSIYTKTLKVLTKGAPSYPISNYGFVLRQDKTHYDSTIDLNVIYNVETFKDLIKTNKKFLGNLKSKVISSQRAWINVKDSCSVFRDISYIPYKFWGQLSYHSWSTEEEFKCLADLYQNRIDFLKNIERSINYNSSNG